jgi:4-amino-4-deoxy-L-arabinose transferase-like glycosyltransferase
MWLGCFVFLVLYLLWLPSPILLLTGDQKVYIQTALEMAEKGEWWVPLHNGEPRFLKPPLHAWIMMLSFKAFGRTFLGAFLPSHLALGLSALTLEWLRRLLNLRGPLLVPLTLLTLGTFTYAQAAQMEMWLVLAWLLASAGFLSWLKDPTHFAALLVSVGVCMLSLLKSPLYTLLWGLGALFVGYGQMGKLFKSRQFWLYGSLSFLVSISWFSSMLIEHREAFWYQYIQQETLEKRFGSQTTCLHLWGAFLLSLQPSALYLGFLKRFPSWSQMRILLAWSVPLFCFFSIFPYRTGTYLFPVLPFVFLVLAHGLHLSSFQKKLVPWLSLVGMAALAGLGFRFEVVSLPVCLFFIALAITFALLSLRYRFKSSWSLLFFPFLCFFLGRWVVWSLAEEEFAPLRNIEGQWALYEPQPNLWQETGWLSLSTKEQGAYLNQMDEAERWLQRGHTLMVAEEHMQESWQPYKWKPWARWPKRLAWEKKGLKKRVVWFLRFQPQKERLAPTKLI